MPILLNVNGTDYFYPEQNDVDWGPDATDWAAAVTSGMLQKAGGLFILLDEVDFGPNHGLSSLYYTSRTANPASSGTLRLARTNVISWRNEANDDDLNLSVNSSDQLLFDGQPIGTITGIQDTDSIDLTIDGFDLEADLKLSSNPAASDYINATVSIETDGLQIQIPLLVGDSGSGGSLGLAPAPAAGDAAANKFLSASGDWETPAGTGFIFDDTDSIDLTDSSNTITADLNLSSASADAGYVKSLNSIESDGLLTQVAILIGDSGSGGTAGLVPAPGAGDAAENKFLKADGTFSITGVPGDILQTSFTALDNQSSPQDVVGLAFDNAEVQSFQAMVCVVRDTTFAQYVLYGVQMASSWALDQQYVGVDTGIVFSITTAGQIQYETSNTGDDASLKFRAWVTQV
jgi:hypothetical protein